MKAATLRAPLAVQLVVVLALSFLGAVGIATPANAETRYVPSGQILRATEPAKVLQSISVYLQAGEKRVIDGRLETKNNWGRLLHKSIATCTGQSGTFSQSTRNTVVGETTHTRSRFVFTAPRAGVYTCQLMGATLVPGASGAKQDPNATLQVNTSSYITVMDNPVPHAQFTMQPDATPNLQFGGTMSTKAVDLVRQSWTAPSGVTSFRAIGDVELTNCYTVDNACATSDSSYNTNSAVVETRLEARQLRSDGSICAITYDGSLRRSTITWSIHHAKLYHQVDVPVSTASGCTRNFQVKVYARWVSGNRLGVEDRQYSGSIILP